MNARLGEVVQIADQRNGLVLIDDLTSLGFSYESIRRLISGGVLRRIHRGRVFALGDSHLDLATEIAAACFAIPESWASGTTAAQYWEFRRVPRGRLEISVPNHLHPKMNGVRVRRTNLLEPDLIPLMNGGQVSSPAQCIFEIAFELDDRTLLSAYEDALNRKVVSELEVRTFGSRAVKMGRHGSARFRRVILGRPDDLAIAMSHDELILAVALAQRDARWIRQVPLRLIGGIVIHLDVARPDIKFGVEIDGELHETPLAIQRDKLRDLHAAAEGWQVIRPTTDDVSKSLKATTTAILRAAAAREKLFKR